MNLTQLKRATQRGGYGITDVSGGLVIRHSRRMIAVAEETTDGVWRLQMRGKTRFVASSQDLLRELADGEVIVAEKVGSQAQ